MHLALSDLLASTTAAAMPSLLVSQTSFRGHRWSFSASQA